MGLAAVPLEPVTVSARSGARSDRTGPGGSDRNYNPEQLARLPIDVSDVNTVATLQPGVLGIRGSDSTATAFSVAGQRPTANNITMDGMSFGSGSLPQDAVRSIRVITRSEEHTSELQSRSDLVCRLLLEKKKRNNTSNNKP